MVSGGFPKLPKGLQRYLITTAQVTGAPVSAVSLGPRFGETVTKGLYEETVGAV